MSSTRNRSTATKMCWMKKTTDAISGFARKESVRVALPPDSPRRRRNFVEASLKSERFLTGPIVPDLLREIHNSFCIESTLLASFDR